MAQPVPYDRGFDFSGFSAASPNQQQPGVQIDAEFNAVKETLDGVLANLELIQRDDTQLRNRSVKIPTLADEVIASLVVKGMNVATWQVATAYDAGQFLTQDEKVFLVAEPHVSTSTAADEVANRIIRVFDSGIPLSLGQPAGSSHIGFSHAESYPPGSVGDHLKRFIVVTDAPFNADPTGATNSTDAFIAASAAIMAAGGGTMVVPPGDYMVGKQTLAGQAGQGWAYVPENPIYIHDCPRAVHLIGHGARLFCEDGMRFGAFDPVTGDAESTSQPFTDADYRATPYTAMVMFSACANVRVEGIELDGNMAGLEVGGGWGDTGIQIPMWGLVFQNCLKASADGVRAHHQGLDGFYVDDGQVDEGSALRPVRLANCTAEYNGRQGLSWVGGNCLTVENGRFAKTGRAEILSAPGCGIDIEPNSGNVCRNGLFVNVEIADCGGVGFLTHVSADIANISVIRSKLIGTTNWAAWPADPGMKFDACLFAGGITSVAADAVFQDCVFTADPALSETGTVNVANGQYLVIDASAGRYYRCTFDSAGVTSHPLCFLGTSAPILQDCAFNQDGTGAAIIRGTHYGRNTVTTAGTVNSAGAVFLGEFIVNGTPSAWTIDHTGAIQASGHLRGTASVHAQGFNVSGLTGIWVTYGTSGGNGFFQAYNHTLAAYVGMRFLGSTITMEPNAAVTATFNTTGMNLASGKVLQVNGTTVVGARGAAVADASGGSTVDAEARTAINTLLARLRTHGLIAT